ncbi:hypothetical protein [Abyssalbus ytuae]|uniref:Uncharacterized protein n=1 Tax=Abyssalbus ytuae TaxID=2926907 RepID=A0A9E6ZQ09_9FLAO|nr:hypothetical protein [Abyssalbus ytuae]UOB16668.1 hypothetical protein MQE35_13090 [Abyssalbus ytuae]
MKIQVIFLKHFIVVSVLILFCFKNVKAQIVTTGAVTDVLGQPIYQQINKANLNMTTKAGINAAALAEVETVISKELLYLTTYNPEYLINRSRINDFIKKESYDFIKVIYPILEPKGNTEFLKNSFVRQRFKMKLEREHKKADSYLALDNYMSEGDRILLLLSSLEKVIKTCMEYEDY